MRYAVLGFGDRAYADFCGHAKALDARLRELGASPVLGRVDGEATDRTLVASWTADLLDAIGDGASAIVETARRLRSEGLPVAAPERFTRDAPILAALSHNEILSAPNSGKEVRRIEFDLTGHDVSYSAGDALGIYPTNREEDVQRWLTTTGFDAQLPVTIDGERFRWPLPWPITMTSAGSPRICCISSPSGAATSTPSSCYRGAIPKRVRSGCGA